LDLIAMHERSKYTGATFSLVDMGFYTGDQECKKIRGEKKPG